MSQNSAGPLATTPRVLIVDDDPFFTTMAETCLADAGYEVRIANDGVEALQILDEDKFDLALIDLSMPRIDGFRLIALIRGAHRLRALAIMVVSAHAEATAFEEAMTLGANGYQKKPVDWTVFAERVGQVLAPAAQ